MKPSPRPDLPARRCSSPPSSNNGFHRPDDARRAFDQTLAALGTDYVDLFLIHWPLPTRYDGDYVSTWETLIEFQRRRSRAVDRRLQLPVGHLARLAAETCGRAGGEPDRGAPVLRQRGRAGSDAAAGILTEAWSPIAQGDVLDDPTVTAIAERLDRTPSQVVLRWHVQRGDIVFPKTTHVERMRENFAIFDFELTADDMDAITALDRGEGGRRGPNPDAFDWIP